MTLRTGVGSARTAHDERRNAAPMAIAGALSRASTSAPDADGKAEEIKERIFIASPAERYRHVLDFVDAKVGSLNG
jgi:hypothetical protein